MCKDIINVFSANVINVFCEVRVEMLSGYSIKKELGENENMMDISLVLGMCFGVILYAFSRCAIYH